MIGFDGKQYSKVAQAAAARFVRGIADIGIAIFYISADIENSIIGARETRWILKIDADIRIISRS